jgi:mRNA interferase RelE/StbE
MSYTVSIKIQVEEFMRRLAPEPRRALRQALVDLREEKGDLKALRGTFGGYFRVRVGRYRVIFRYLPNLEIEAVFAADRELVYKEFVAEATRRLEENRARYSWLKLAPRKMLRRRRTASGGSHKGVSR